MSEKIQNLVVSMEPSENACNTPLKGRNMILKNFLSMKMLLLFKDAALSEVNSLKKSSFGMEELKRKEKGKEYSF